MDDVLRKPDFQRATWAWTPEDCVSLLESIVKEQVIPSIIMWLSPDKLWYVLDGGHRISVVLAWLKDDWGDKLPSEEYKDKELEEKIKGAAGEVRQLLASKKIGRFDNYRIAYRQYQRDSKLSKDAEVDLDSETARRVAFYSGVVGGIVGFPLQWVKGAYETAEESFININKSGRKLSTWETKLVENRRSSFARVVMSVANIADAEHCWPTKASEEPYKTLIKQNVTEIVDGVSKFHRLLFEPPYDPSFGRLQQPVLVESRVQPETKPAYTAELLTIMEGGRGQEPQIEALLKRDRSASDLDITTNGLKLISSGLEVLTHLVGPSSQPQSLALVPLLYFYNDAGTHVRGLLYGLVYWLFSESDEDILLTRKRIFSAHRASFEQVFMTDKENVIRRIGRNIGSGPEVTYAYARYYQGLLELLIRYKGDITSQGFTRDYKEFVDKLKVPESKAAASTQEPEGRSRVFTEKQKSTVLLRSLLRSQTRCGICEGILDLQGGLQHDHIVKWSEGGQTLIENSRLTHPFCNNNRDIIEGIKSGQRKLKLPVFLDPELSVGAKQLQLFNLNELDPYSDD